MIRVVLADDQPLVLRGLEALLGAEPDIEVIGTAADGAAALDQVRRLQPDVACLDIRMPRMNGIEVTRELLGSTPPDAAPTEFSGGVLILTTFDIDDYVFGALEAGASGFLLKDAEPYVIAQAVRRVAAGEGTLDQSLTKRIMAEFAARRRLTPLRSQAAQAAAAASATSPAKGILTERETEILHLLARGLSNADIAAALHVEASTVKSHLARMLPKLGVRSRLQAVVWAYQNRVVSVDE